MTPSKNAVQKKPTAAGAPLPNAQTDAPAAQKGGKPPAEQRGSKLPAGSSAGGQPSGSKRAAPEEAALEKNFQNEVPPPLAIPAQADLAGLPFEKLQAYMGALGQPAFRAGQIFSWLHKQRASSYAAMGNLPAALRTQLAARHPLGRPSVARRQLSSDGTRKYLLRLADGNCVEAVLMHYHYGYSLCISTQVGCRMGCRFCASTQGGLLRNLTAAEMAGEVYAVLADLEAAPPSAEEGPPVSPADATLPARRQPPQEESAAEPVASGLARISHVVLMGMGEPLDNYDNVLDFLHIITDPQGQNLSWRNISLSTCGVVPGIRRLAEEKLPLTLSVSLHAAGNAARSALMPANDAWPIEKLLEACRAYQRHTGRRISYEYALVAGVNDNDSDAQSLAGLLRGSGGHVNLIPVNAVDGSPYTATDKERVNNFCQTLQNLGINATVRRRLGTDIDAACGQLRLRYTQGEPKREAARAKPQKAQAMPPEGKGT